MKDNILCIFIMLFVSVTFNANAQKSPQGQFSVKGVLVDSLSNEGEPYSTIRISLKSNPAKPVKLAVTDTNGKFSERLVSPGTYLISFSSVGKRTVQKEFTVSDTKKALRYYDKLNEWMFDYRNLIYAGLAIDVNTLPENPYE